MAHTLGHTSSTPTHTLYTPYHHDYYYYYFIILYYIIPDKIKRIVLKQTIARPLSQVKDVIQVLNSMDILLCVYVYHKKRCKGSTK